MELINNPLAMSRLLWLRDNHPYQLLDLYQKGELKQEVEKIVDQAIQLQGRLDHEQGVAPDIAEEYALKLVAPAEDMSLEPKREINQRQFDQIVDSLLK